MAKRASLDRKETSDSLAVLDVTYCGLKKTGPGKEIECARKFRNAEFLAVDEEYKAIV